MNWRGLFKLGAPDAPQPRASLPGRNVIRGSSYYESAGNGRKTNKMRAGKAGPNQIASDSAETIRDRSRDAVRKQPHAGAALDSYTANAIGTGIKPQSLHPDAGTREKLHQAFRRWTDSADFDDQTDYYGLQALCWRSMMEAGEVLIRIRTAPARMGLKIPLQLEVVEADHLPYQDSGIKVPEGHTLRCGIEFDRSGRKVAYHLYREHPNETYFYTNNGRETERIPAEQIIHLFHRTRPKQARGIPWLANVIVRLNQIDKYDDAELERKIICSSITGFISGQSPDDPVFELKEGATEAVQNTFDVEPGMMIPLNAGEDIKLVEAKESGNYYDVFLRTQLHAVAIGAGITYEQLTGDLEGVNYSSIRAGLLEFRRKCEQIQHSVFVFQFCRRVWNEWTRYAALSGVIPYGEYLQNRDEFEDCRHIPPGWPWVDPLKDITAAVAEIDAKLNSRSNVISSRGEDPEEIDKQIAADEQRAQRLGLHNSEDPQKLEQQKKQTAAMLAEPDTPSKRRKQEVLQ